MYELSHTSLSMSEQIKSLSPEQISPETQSSPEQITVPEQGPIKPEAQTSEQLVTSSPATPSAPQTIDITQAQRVADIEHILEEDLKDIYAKLPSEDQVKFRLAGEKAARDIYTLLETATATLKKIIDIITGWLRLIPGVSKYFLEQEAKIKADRLYKLQDHD